jgi:hypothetical protein
LFEHFNENQEEMENSLRGMIYGDMDECTKDPDFTSFATQPRLHGN